MNIPENLKYTKDHEWIQIEGDVATIGITAFAQSELGEVVSLDTGDTLVVKADSSACSRPPPLPL